MVNLFWKIADEYARKDIQKKEVRNEPQFYYSKNVHFSLPNKIQTNIKNTILSTDSKYEDGEIRYESLLDNEECNKSIIINYKKNILNKTAKNIILIHGWKQTSFNKIDAIMYDYLINNGYNIYYFTLPFHLNRREKNSRFSGEYMISANIDRTILSFTQAVSDLQTLVNYLKNTLDGKVVTIGLSLGCIVNNLLTSFEKNLDANISLFYPNDMSYLTYNAPIEMLILNEFKQNNISEADLKIAWDSLTPSNYTPKIPKDKIFLLSGRYDKFVPLSDSDTLYKSWNFPPRVVLNCGHAGIALYRKQILKQVKIFIERV